MRIIGGERKGRVITMPKGVAVRPTQDRVREAVFNIIREVVPGSCALDLFAGSGAFGMEALSRGAESAIFIDNNTECIKVIKHNLALLGYDAPRAQVFKKDGIKVLEAFAEQNIKFDLVFMDPPYYMDLAKNALIKIGSYDILSQHSFIIIEHSKKDDLPEKSSNLRLFKRKNYGDTAISLYTS